MSPFVGVVAVSVVSAMAEVTRDGHSDGKGGIRVLKRSGEELVFVHLPADAEKQTVRSLKHSIHAALQQEAPKYASVGPNRQRLTLTQSAGEDKAGNALNDNETLSTSGVLSAREVALKDLGPQIGYRTVYVAEYLGPMLIYPFLCLPMLQPVLYGTESAFALGLAQKLALLYWTAHYAKRIAETLLVHRFSKPTMPLQNLFRNCTYYFVR